MLSDVSDLSDSSHGGATQSKRKTTGYRLRNVLKPGRTTQYTAKALYDQIADNDIDLDPEYQRDVVWSEAKQIGLIDSIFRNFYIPPIIFAVTTEDDGTEKRVCIDGKQRLTSIQKFISGVIPHRDPFTNEKLWFIDSSSGPKRKLLPPQYKTLFQNKQIVCIEYSDLPPDLEREVFQRVQMGMALTTAEKMQAISGPWPDLVREITNEYYVGVDGISENMDLNHARARDFQNIAQTMYCIDQLPDQVQGTTMQVEKWLTREEEPSESTRKRMHDVFRIFRDIVRDRQLRTPLKKPSRVAPAEFIMIGILIAMFKDRLSLPQLSQAIGILRTETRAEHVDVRTNSKVFKTMFQVISKQIKVSTLAETPGSLTAGSTSGALALENNSALGKRKRREGGNRDSSGDEQSLRKPREPLQQNPPNPLPITHPALSSGSQRDLVAPSQAKNENGTAFSSASTPSGNGTSLPPAIGPRFSRIQAAKAQAALIASRTESRPLTPITPHSVPSQQTPHPPHLQNYPQQTTNPLEAMMRGSGSLESCTTHSPTSLLNLSTQAHHHQGLPLSNTIQIPIPANNVSKSSTNYPGSEGHQPNGSPRSSKDERSDSDRYRERHVYFDADSRHNSPTRDWDNGRDHSQSSSYSYRDRYPTPRGTDSEHRPERDVRDPRRGPEPGYRGR